jgi:hypothetical protein
MAGFQVSTEELTHNGRLADTPGPARLPARASYPVDGVRVHRAPCFLYFLVFAQGPETGGGTTLGTNAAGGTNGLVSVDALQEFRILTNSYAPEYGRTPGGQVILLTRSGTNQFHGDLFEYFRNDVLDANDWFANSLGHGRAPLRFNDFGGVLGGPIVPNHTFFFFSYEGQRLRQPQFVIENVPDLASRQAASPAVQALLDAYPIPNGPNLGGGQAQFSAGFSNPLSTDATSFRVDQVFTSTLSGFVRYNYAPSTSDGRNTGGYDSLASIEELPYKTQTLTLGTTYLISSAMVNETRLNFSSSTQSELFTFDAFGGATPPPASALFVPPLTPQNGVAFVYLGFKGSAFYDGENTANKQRQINLTDGLSYVLGAHQLKFGVDYRQLLPYTSGYFGDDYFFDSLSNAVSNTLPEFLHLQDSSTRADIKNLSLYAQDSWRVTSRLNVTYGLRWEVNTPPRDLYANNGNYIPLLGNYVTGNVTAGPAGSPLWNTQYLNFAPRLGIAYVIRQTPGWETVLRAGGGLFYDLGTGDSALNPWLNGFPNQNSAVASTSLPIAAGLATQALYRRRTISSVLPSNSATSRTVTPGF